MCMIEVEAGLGVVNVYEFNCEVNDMGLLP